jgi:hypothetical protein
MPPALIPLALVALGVPAAMRALVGRPRSLGRAWILALTAVAIAQAAGELTATRIGMLGDAQLLFAALGAAIAGAGLALAEGEKKR